MNNEIEMYAPVAKWFQEFLSGRLPKTTVEVHDTHAMPLNGYIKRLGLHGYFDSDLWQTFDIRVDLTAFLAGSIKGIAFVECKMNAISLRDVSQLLGYSRVALPLFSYLISSSGVGGSVKSILQVYGRFDILEYAWQPGSEPRKLVLAKWDSATKGLDATTVLPPGS